MVAARGVVRGRRALRPLLPRPARVACARARTTRCSPSACSSSIRRASLAAQVVGAGVVLLLAGKPGSAVAAPAHGSDHGHRRLARRLRRALGARRHPGPGRMGRGAGRGRRRARRAIPRRGGARPTCRRAHGAQGHRAHDRDRPGRRRREREHRRRRRGAAPGRRHGGGAPPRPVHVRRARASRLRDGAPAACASQAPVRIDADRPSRSRARGRSARAPRRHPPAARDRPRLDRPLRPPQQLVRARRVGRPRRVVAAEPEPADDHTGRSGGSGGAVGRPDARHPRGLGSRARRPARRASPPPGDRDPAPRRVGRSRCARRRGQGHEVGGIRKREPAPARHVRGARGDPARQRPPRAIGERSRGAQGAAPHPGLSRCADRAAEPVALRRVRRRGAVRSSRRRPGGAVPRPRRLQADQRQPRAPRR